jgi:HEAT repeat protein
MSPSLRDPASAPKTELETVTRWPALLAAAAAGAVLLGVPLLLACASALRSRPAALESMAHRAAPAPVAPVVAQALTLPQKEPTSTTRAPEPPAEPVRTVLLPGKEPVVAVVPAKPEPEPRPFPRRDRRTVEELLKSLKDTSREVRLEAKAGTAERLLKEAKADANATPALDEIARRPDLVGLPVRQASECKADATRAKLMTCISRGVRKRAATNVAPSTAESFSSRVAVMDWIGMHPEYMCEDGIPTLHQMMQVEEEDTRLHFMAALRERKGPAATTALCQSALYDLSPHVREAAVQALKAQSPKDVRKLLLAGLRHPWAPVADHAAEALAALDDQKALPDLVAMLDQNDPCAPVRKGNNPCAAAELVRVNHLGNCLLCHAPSLSQSDFVRGFVPTPGQALPRAYYGDFDGNFVRADVTYLRQDFSVMELVHDAAPWPLMQRFDFLVRNRTLTAAEAARWEGVKTPPTSYPQREAVLFALRELTSLDAGKSSLAWRLAMWMKDISSGP